MEVFVEIWFSDTPTNSLKNSDANFKVKIMEKEELGYIFLFITLRR
jgi:hypothetical protein